MTATSVQLPTQLLRLRIGSAPLEARLLQLLPSRLQFSDGWMVGVIPLNYYSVASENCCSLVF